MYVIDHITPECHNAEQTTPAQKAKEHFIHTWLGTEAMRQRRAAGCTALLAVQLRTHLGSSVKKLIRNVIYTIGAYIQKLTFFCFYRKKEQKKMNFMGYLQRME